MEAFELEMVAGMEPGSEDLERARVEGFRNSVTAPPLHDTLSFVIIFTFCILHQAACSGYKNGKLERTQQATDSMQGDSLFGQASPISRV